jgi:hypothetical protein
MHRALNDPALDRRPIHPALAVLVCVIACTAIALCVDDEPTRPRPLIAPLGRDFILQKLNLAARSAAIVSTAGMLTAFLFAVSYVFRILHHIRARRTPVLVGLFVIATVSVPIVIEVVRNLMHDTNRFTWSRVAGASPAGTLILVWANGGADPVPGIIVQMLIAITLALLFHLTARPKSAAEPLPA